MAPSLGLVLTLLAALVDAGAAEFAPCAPGPKEKKPPTLEQVMACQEAARKDLGAAHEKQGKTPPPELLDRLDEHHRAEVRAFLKAHPDQALIEGREEAPEEPKSFLERLGSGLGGAGKKFAGLFRKPAGPKDIPPEHADAAAALRAVQKAADKDADVGEAVSRHNKQLDENSDPEMKKFYRKPASGD